MSSEESENFESKPLARGSLTPGVSAVPASAAGEVREELSGENLDGSSIKQIGIICSGFVVFWVIVSGAWDIYQDAVVELEMYGSTQSQEEVLPEFEYRQQSFFERIFCSGAKRSSFCGS